MSSDAHKYAPVADPLAGGQTLGEGFLAPPVDSPTPSQAQPFLEVVAPATLPEGYTFEAEANGHSFAVRVPAGGVEEGQTFSVPFPAGATGYSGAAVPRASVPVGAWRDGLCACFKHGLVHPMLWNACCCRLVLIGQLMQRLKLNWLANDSSNAAQSKAAFRIYLSLALVYFALDRILAYRSSWFWFVGMGVAWEEDDDIFLDDPDFDAVSRMQSLRLALGFSFFAATVFLTTKIRQRVRAKYAIPAARCAGCEDLCCSLWCNCCTVAQLARHTADYTTYAGLCCSETGLSEQAPSIV